MAKAPAERDAWRKAGALAAKIAGDAKESARAKKLAGYVLWLIARGAG